MRVIIVGAGEVGYQIARFLTLEDIDVVVIDKDKSKLKRVSEELDVAVIEGEGGDPSILKQAEADKADILLAVTDKDETNMIACLLAKAMFNIPRKIARIRNPEYIKNKQLLSKDNLNIDPAISPEFEIAKAIIKLMEIPFATDVEDFEGGIIKVIGIKITEDSPLINKSLKEITKNLSKKFLIGLIEREDKVIVPSGNSVLKRNDIIYIPIKKIELPDMIEKIGIKTKPARKIMLLGGGNIGYYIASFMELKANVKMIEKDVERCKYLSKNLNSTLILHGDGADQKLLLEENISDMDIFAAVSNNDEVNIMSGLLAKKLGAKKTIAIVNRMDYIPLAHSLGLQAVLCPRLITASTILRYIRKGDILSLTAIAEDKAEIIEARVGDASPLIGKMLKDAKFPKASIIGAILRDENIIIPSGNDVISENDKLIIFTLRESFKEVEKILT